MKKKCLWILLAAAALLTAVVTYLLQPQPLEVVSFCVDADLKEPIRIVHLTDLHSYEFGEGNSILVKLVAEQEPDLIMITGDMWDRSDQNADVVCSLIRELVTVAPVYYGYGNHEKEWEAIHAESLTVALEEAGAVVLDCSYADVMVAGTELRIGGYHGYYRQPSMFPISPEQCQAELDFCDEFENTDRYKILLSHIPTAWIDWGYMNKFPVDLVLSGHYHGGQIVLPWIGGIYAPYIGLFPPNTKGMFQGETAVCILSAGLGSSPGIPRINNPPQIVVVELIPKT